ncbi:Trypanosomal VSG domain containing protein, putative [Trypanosoma equiperdum]|uniref:Trypanosomal VSG domain containing protein, putative n=1 Tax=Trypanosoma equiperdum TaxID=5694 RepID=A0A1G4I0R8_TRYEQ|nr:Trypanosomal VSG domain containing protein, putative [Trypanosoma equiperdum]
MIRYAHSSSEYAIFAITKALVLLLLAAELGNATVTKNGKGFFVICEIYKLCTVEADTTDLTRSDTPEPPDDIEDLYIVTLPTVNFTAKIFSTFNEQAWEQKKSLLEAQPPETKPKYLRIGDEQTRQLVHWEMARIRRAATEARGRLKDAETMIQCLTARVRTHLKQELREETNETTDNAIFGTHDTMYGSNSPYDQGHSLASDLACLSFSVTASNLCVAGGYVHYYKKSVGDSAGNAKAGVETIITKCSTSGTQRHVTPSTTDSAITQFAGLFGTAGSSGSHAKDVIGGCATNNDCDGQHEDSACIDYNGVVKNKDITKIPWVKQLLEARKLLIEAEKQTQQLNANKAILQGLQLQAKTVYDILGSKQRNRKAFEGEESATPDIRNESGEKIKGDCTRK